MHALSVLALIVPSSDSHNSEYVAVHLQRRSFLTGFRGSAGVAVITGDKALLWTDGRYWLEATEALYPEFELMKQGQPDTPTLQQWLENNLGGDAPIGLDPSVCTIAEWERMQKGLSLKAVEDIVGPMMEGEGTPEPLYLRPVKFSGASTADRRAAIVEELKKQKCDFTVLSGLDETAWLTNLRGRDVAYNPVFYSYAIVDVASTAVKLYVNLAKVTSEVRTAVGHDIEFLPYDQLESDIRAMPESRTVLVDERGTNQALYTIMQERAFVIKRVPCGPAQKLKGIKNEVELQGFRNCHRRDGASLTRYLAWLHDQIVVKRVTDLNEFDAAAKLEGFRATNEHYIQLSFTTISSTGPNGAMCHYSAPATGSAVIRADQLYLVDSGAQYLDGTTDVTRTVCFDVPRVEEQEAYTRVLKGHIALDRVIFPKGVSGHRLDVLARTALWQVGLDYAHGTGHGVGSFLCVHEGPHGVGIHPVLTEATLDLHSIITNEPGYYKEGQYGIRIENECEVVSHPTAHSTDGFLKISSLTVVPLCRDLIDVSLLTEEERAWVNAYHARVEATLLPILEAAGDDLAVQYLKRHAMAL